MLGESEILAHVFVQGVLYCAAHQTGEDVDHTAGHGKESSDVPASSEGQGRTVGKAGRFLAR